MIGCDRIAARYMALPHQSFTGETDVIQANNLQNISAASKVENQQLKNKWTDRYLFSMPATGSYKLMSLMCNECISVMKRKHGSVHN